MFGQEKNYVSVFINDAMVKMAHVRVHGNESRLMDVARLDLRSIEEAQRPKLIHDAIAGFQVKNPYAVCAVPSNIAITKNIEIPSLDPQEIKSIIDLQAGRHTPYSREEILIGYVNIGTFQRNYTKILLIIINRTVLKKQLDLLSESGMRVDRVSFIPEGMARFYARALKSKDGDAPVAVIDIGQGGTDFIVVFNRTVSMCRNIPVGLMNLIKEGPAAQEQLIAELVKSQEAYQNEDINALPETYLLTSDDAKIKDLLLPLQEKLKAPVKIVPYLDHVKASQPVMLKMVSEYNGDSFLDILGMLYAAEDMKVDLTPEEVRTQRAIEEKGREIVKSGTLAIILLALICGLFFSKIYFKSLFLNSLEKEYTQKRKMVVRLDRTAQKTRIIKDYINSRMVSLDIINEIYRLIPNEIYLQSILIDENGSVELIGTSESMSRVFNFVSALEESELFKSVKTKSTTAKKDRGKDVAAFELSFTLTSVKETEAAVSDEEKLEEKISTEEKKE